MHFGLNSEIVSEIQQVLSGYPTVNQAIVYGSRALGTYRNESDIDLTLTGKDLHTKMLSRIAADLDDLLLPYTFDLSIYRQIDNKSLINHIERVGIIFYERDPKYFEHSTGDTVKRDHSIAVKEGWQVKKLGEVCSFLNRGISPTYLENGGVCVLNQKCIRDHEANFDLSRRHDAKIKKVAEERFICIGDVLVNSTGTGTLGRVAQVREEPEEATTIDSHVTIVRPTRGLYHLDFFGYMLIVIEDAIKEAGEGCGGQTELARSILAERFSVSYPESLPEQQRIVGLLDEAFASIAIAKTNAEKNLQNARALFESHSQAVFENGNWETKNLEEVCDEIFAGGDAPKNNFSSEPNDKHRIPIYANAVKNRGLYGYTDFARVTKPSITIAARRSGTGHSEIRFDQYLPIVRLIVLIPNLSLINLAFLKHGIDSLEVVRSGSASPQLTVPMIKEYDLPLPSLAEQNEIVQKLSRLQKETQELEIIYQQKLAALDALKKSLLHQAFSGAL